MAQIALFLVAAVLGTAIHGYEVPSPHYRSSKKDSSITGQTHGEIINPYDFYESPMKQGPPVRQWPSDIVPPPLKQDQRQDSYSPSAMNQGPPFRQWPSDIVPPPLKQDQRQDSFSPFAMKQDPPVRMWPRDVLPPPLKQDQRQDSHSPFAMKQDSSSYNEQTSTTEESTPVPSRDNSRYHCFRDGLYPNPLDCTTYIQCSGRQANIKVCPAGMHYNRRTQRCDQPCNARCDPRACRQTSSARLPDFVCRRDGLYRNPEDCTSYIQCSNGRSFVMPCVRGLHYNAETQRCEAPCYAHCDDSIAEECGWTDLSMDNPIIPENDYRSVQSSLPDGFTCLEDGLFLNPENCSTYLRCFDGRATTLQCPENLHFSQQNLRCEAPCDAHCDESISEDCGWALWQYNILKEDFTCDKDGLFKNPEDCSTYTQCSSGQGYVMPCLKGLHFSEKTQSCETPCDAGCDPTLAEKCSSEAHGPMLKQPIFDFSCIRSGLYENHADCGSFIQCTGGSAYLISCPYGQHFDHRTKKCEEPCTAQCDPNIDSQCREDRSFKRRPHPVHWNSAKQSSDFTCYEDGLYPDPQDCSSYIRCSNGQSRTLTCPRDLHYSQDTKKCESPCDARCDASLKEMCGWNYKVKGARQSEYDSVCSSDGAFQNPSNCSSYIQCSDQQAHIVSCPEGLHFSKETETCEIPCHAQCDQNLAEFCGWESTPEFSTETHLVSTLDSSLIVEDFDCQRDGYYDSGECTTYVLCLNEVAYLLPCPRGLHFSQETQKCMLPREAHCNHNIVPVTQQDVECEAEPDSGPCFGTLPRYYYDINSGRCRRFIYGGCGGNSNRFETESECKERCQRRFLGPNTFL